MIRLTTSQSKKGILYRVGYGFRIFCGIAFAFLSWGIILYLVEGDALSTMVVPLILWALALVGLCYRETWLFDPHAREVTSYFGIGPIVKKQVYPYQDIDGLEITHFVRGAMEKDAIPNRRKKKQAMIVFSLVLQKDEERRTIEVIPERTSEGRTENAAQAISAVSGLSLTMDRPRDMDLKVNLRDL